MQDRNFDEWLSHFTDSISGYGYYTDFDKVAEHADSLKVELNILNSLIGSKDIERDFIELLNSYPKVLRCIPVLLAVRGNEIKAMDGDGKFCYKFTTMNQTPEQYAVFMRKTGLFDLISNRIVNNLYDYVLGVEAGLDSNARKNRGGHQMEDLVEAHLRELGVRYWKEMYISTIEGTWNLDLSPINNQGQSTKRFDFVVESGEIVYGIEVNFYASNGSKLNETARSYKMIALESKDVEGFEFVWITDGWGWKGARSNLKETFDVLDNMYSIDDIDNGALRELFLSD